MQKSKKPSKPIEDKDGNKSNRENRSKGFNKNLNKTAPTPVLTPAPTPVLTPAPKPTRALNDPRYKNE